MRQVSVGTFEATPKTRELVNQVLDTGRISYGPLSRKLEEWFAALHDCRFAVLSNSGTSSLQVALQALKELNGWEDGDEVIVPAVTFVATVNIVLHNRMKPVLTDVYSGTYNVDPNQIEAAVTDRTRAIIPVHLFGCPAEMWSVMDIADRKGLSVIEDSCECMFADIGGRRVGSFGDVGCFSTYVAHLITSGVGGIATTNDSDLAVKMRSLVNHGRDGIYISIDDDDTADEKRLVEIVERRFNFESIGHSYRITELEAALALAQLDKWEEMIAKRQANAEYLTGLLEPLEKSGKLQLPWVPLDSTHSFMMYPVVVKTEGKWDLCHYLENHGVETREMLRLTDQPVYVKMGLWDPADYPVAATINAHGFYVGCHQGLGKEDMEYVASLFHNWFGPYQGV